jgi:hypothetical protein
VTEKAFRLDFLIAIAALLVSTLSAFALFYQTRVVADQYAATIWPYLEVNETYSERGEILTIDNDGVGPALVQSAQLYVNGKPVHNWGEYFSTLLRNPAMVAFFKKAMSAAESGKTPGSMRTSSVDPGMTIRAGESKIILKIDLAGLPYLELAKTTLALDLCYCSLNNSCWTLNAGQEASRPKPVGSCTASAAIAAPQSIMSLSQPRRKKSP